MRTVIQIVLFIVAIVLTYFIYQSIQRPIAFEKAKDARYEETVAKLKDIRKAQLAYKDIYGQFTGSWDTLISFVSTDSVRNVRAIGELTDSMIEAKITEKKAIEMGLIIRDTVKVGVIDALYGGSYDANSLRYVPVPGEPTEFHLGATIITTGSGIKVPVFEAKAHNNVILRGLDEQLIINLNDQRRTNEKYPGLRVGSLAETNNNAGNWE
ncbi:hypothetical protein [Draconibacterium halophilum]|uniref:Uncharacterized protein n=1 Tax=Draconibacterium halophilum TaxID=2706887 RepID=A0A6C0RE50_9BACT|nr:hypothetical protein [Draconibacterium halophilum]QIA07793.1 hypothetical protein G0Q07_08660 [Draconibacterium halophilum]